MPKRSEKLLLEAEDLRNRAELRLEQFAIHASRLRKGTADAKRCAVTIRRIEDALEGLETYRKAVDGASAEKH